MNNKPSWQSSTLSQLLSLTVLLYGAGTLVLIAKGKVSDLVPFQWLLNILLPLYGVKRGVESAKTNGQAFTFNTGSQGGTTVITPDSTNAPTASPTPAPQP